MSKKIAILLQTGFGAKSYPGQGAGIHILARDLSDIYWDRRQSWIGVRVHDAPAEQDACDVVERFGADVIVHVGHSFGTGHGLLEFARRLAAHNRRIDLACCIDAVPDVWFGHFPKTESPFPNFPANVQAVWFTRTKFKPGFFTPWGRRIHHPNVVGKLVFDDNPGSPTHGTIDEHPRVHEEIIDAIGGLA